MKSDNFTDSLSADKVSVNTHERETIVGRVINKFTARTESVVGGKSNLYLAADRYTRQTIARIGLDIML